MPGRDERIYDEAAALWRQLYGEPPPAAADGSVILDLILDHLPGAEYERLATPHLRRSNITFPRY
ncbi:hypothetical protein [Phenylobacterium sp.]|jgi:hypothetical protein|uniref:hypothetical protein n=1 Tax=Phenylobacterium sp. TaxID=1871053 RepID=UPI002EDB4C2F